MNCRVKICGITRVEDALAAEAAGADAVGLVFYSGSKRYVTAQQALAIKSALGPFVKTVALVVNASTDEIDHLLDAVRPDLIQFHGDETPEFCQQFSVPFIRAIRMHPELNIEQEIARYANASGFLFDAWDADQYGGTGKQFNWQRLPSARHFPLILAGGLTPANVAEAVAQVEPYAVDVSGGVELAPGIKDANKVQQFIAAAKGRA